MSKQQNADAWHHGVLGAVSHAEDLAAYGRHLTLRWTVVSGRVGVLPETSGLLSSALARGLMLGMQHGFIAMVESPGVLEGLAFIIEIFREVIEVLLGPDSDACRGSPIAVQLAECVARYGGYHQ